MQNPFQYFDKIYCINLPDRTDRWKLVLQEFEKMDINPTRISGVYYSGWADKRRNASVGNHLAHAECIQDAIDNNLNNILILEDDIQFFFTKDFTYNILDNAIKTLPKSWGLFYLGINMDRYLAHTYSPYLAKLGGGLSTHAYAINQPLFYELRDINNNVQTIHNDIYYAEVIMKHYDCFVTNPLLAGQRTGFSDIMGTIVNSNDMFKQRFRDNLR